jgi:hypothetical protein
MAARSLSGTGGLNRAPRAPTISRPAMRAFLTSIARSPKLHRRVTIAGLVLVGLACVGMLLAVVLSQGRPGWWRTVDRSDPLTAERAEQIEDLFTNQVYKTRPSHSVEVTEWQSGKEAKAALPLDHSATLPLRRLVQASDDWTIRISADDATAWLATRLPKWLANREDRIHWPPEIGELQVQFDGRLVHVGAKVRTAGKSDSASGGGSGPPRQHILSATLWADLRPDGSLWLPARWVYVGRLAVPASWVLGQVRRSGNAYIPEELRRMPETATMLRAFDGEGPIVQNALIKLGDGRRVRILRIAPRDGKLDITCRTEQP